LRTGQGCTPARRWGSHPTAWSTLRERVGCYHDLFASGRMPDSKRLWSIVVAGGLVLGGLLAWFFGNFFYDLLWSYLESRQIQHSIVIEKVIGHIVPFILSAILIGVIYAVLRHELMTTNSPFAVGTGAIRADMRINDAIDYVVNDSTAKLKQPEPPTIMQYGPAKGSRLIQKGVEHEDARKQLNNELISGNVQCWGRRQLITVLPVQFEDTVREIEKSYWENMQISFFAALYHTETQPQTAIIPGRPESHHWTALTVSRRQVQQIWRRKSASRRLVEKWKGRERIKALPDPINS